MLIDLCIVSKVVGHLMFKQLIFNIWNILKSRSINADALPINVFEPQATGPSFLLILNDPLHSDIPPDEIFLFMICSDKSKFYGFL